MSTSPFSLIAPLLLAGSLSAAAQCPIKDRIMSEMSIVPSLPTDEENPETEWADKASSADKNKLPHCTAEPTDSFERVRIGAYGEILARFKHKPSALSHKTPQPSSNTWRNTIAIPRFVLAMDYKFTSQWKLSTAIALDNEDSGAAFEPDATRSYALMPRPITSTQVRLERLYLECLIHPAFNLRAGHMIVPVSQTNVQHSPTQYFGAVRPEGENTLLPSTWHETGLAAYGRWGSACSRFGYEAMVVTGLNAYGFSPHRWVARGQQGGFNPHLFNAPAFVGRISWAGHRGTAPHASTLRLGVSYYHCSDASANADYALISPSEKPLAVNIFTADAHYHNRYVTARANVVLGQLSNSPVLNRELHKLSSFSPSSPLTPVAEQTLSYAGEAGVRLRSIWGETLPDLVPFVRYEHYHPQAKVQAPEAPLAQLKTRLFTAGLNYRIGKDLVLKANYTTHRLGENTPRTQNEWAVGIAFDTWFWNK